MGMIGGDFYTTRHDGVSSSPSVSVQIRERNSKVEKKIVVNNESGMANVGNHVIELKDLSYDRFKTGSIEDFIDFVIGKSQNETISVDVYYSGLSAEAYLSEIGYQGEFANLSIRPHRLTDKLTTIIDQTFTNIKSLEKRLRPFKDYIDDAGLEILSRSLSFSAERIISFTENRNQAGEYLYNYSCKSGDGAWVPPEYFEVTIPVIHDLPEKKMTFKVDVFFEFQQVDLDEDKKVFKPVFKFKSDDFECVFDYYESVMSCQFSKYFDAYDNIYTHCGSVTRIRKTDAYKYLFNVEGQHNQFVDR